VSVMCVTQKFWRDAQFARRSTNRWMAAQAGKLPIAPVLGLQAALANRHVQNVGMVQALPHAQDAGFRVLANPIKLDGQRLSGRGCSALGADGAALWATAEHGSSAQRLDARRP